jgi:hypothetical protein
MQLLSVKQSDDGIITNECKERQWFTAIRSSEMSKKMAELFRALAELPAREMVRWIDSKQTFCRQICADPVAGSLTESQRRAC